MKKLLKPSLLLAGLLPISSFSLWGQTFDTWTKINSGTTEALNKVSMLNSSFGVAVGSNLTVLKWDGNVWSPISGVLTSGFDAASHLSAVSVINSDLVLIGGSLGTNTDIYRALSVWNGTTWSSKINGGPGGNSISEFWTDNSGLILTSRTYHTRITRYDGANVATDIANNANWTLPQTATGPSLFGIHGASANAIFSVGVSGTVLRSVDEGLNWSSISTEALESTHWYSVFALSGSQVLMGGTDSKFGIWDGTNWSTQTITFGSLNASQVIWRDIYAFDANNIWMVGNLGAVKHYNGIVWSDVYLQDIGTNALFSIDYDGSSLWITGAGGSIYQATIPETQTVVLLLGGFVLMASSRRFHRKLS